MVLILVPFAAHVGIRAYVAWFMRSPERQVVDRRLAVDGGGGVDVRGVEIRENGRDRPAVFAWQAIYRSDASANLEVVGTWEATREGTTAYRWRGLVVVIPNTDYYERGIQRVFVRKGSDWTARYEPPGAARPEDIGTWFGRLDEVAVASAGGRVIVVAMPDQVFVRTERGAWKRFAIRFPQAWEREGVHAADLRRLGADLGLARRARSLWLRFRSSPRSARRWWST